jgi:sulfatase modifying factor 1
MIPWLLACATQCPPGSSLADDGLCHLDEADTAQTPACEVAAPGAGEVVGTIACEAGICEVPAGAFVQGDANPDAPEQCPPRVVTLSAFAIDETEVTIGAYRACEAAGGCTERPHCVSAAEESDDLPVTCVTWQQAADFCAWAGGRLPTEAEWEKAARGEDGALWPWGDYAPTCNLANFRYVIGYCHGEVVPVGGYVEPTGSPITDTRSGFGLLDVAGNAWEWTADSFDAGYYAVAPDTDPPGPESCSTAVDGERGTCRYRSIRGGAFNATQDSLRGSSRSFADPAIRDTNIGLRCAYSR